MSTTGGSVLSVSMNGVQYSVPADADFTDQFGGFQNEMQANGDGTTRLIKTRVPGVISGVVVNCDNSRQDREAIEALRAGKELFDLVVEYADGALYSGRAQVTGEPSYSSQNSTMSLNLSIEGKMVQL